MLNTRQVRLGDSATLSQNFLISTPAVPDGSMSITRESGTHVLDIDASGKVTFPGNVQTWQDVSGSRTSGTTYTNSTGLSISVSVWCNNLSTAGGTGYQFLVNGSIVHQNIVPGASLASNNASPGAVIPVPAGATYRVDVISSAVAGWRELR
jgi:hypothetical protein